MKTDPIEFGICLNCGSTEYIEDYPVEGKRICVKCGHENVIELKLVGTGRQTLDVCPFCGKEREEDDILFDRDEIIVFKCRKCEKLDGYKFPDFLEYDADFDGAYDSLSVEIAKQEGNFIHPASKYQEFEKALRKKEKSPVEKCKKRLSLLIHEKSQEMKAEGICYETIGRARWQTQFFIERKGPLTNKQLKSLFAAALQLAQSSELISNGKTLTKKVSESQLERIFNTTRKTIRKWKKILQQLFYN